MEKRAILAAVLMALLLIFYQQFLVPSGPPAQKEAPGEASKGATGEGMGPGKPSAGSGAAPTAATPAEPARPAAGDQVVRQTVRPPQRTVTVEGPLYHAVVSSAGGKIQRWTLRYRGEKDMVIVGEIEPRGLVIGGPSGHGEVVDLETRQDAVTVGAETPTGDVVLRGEIDGLAVDETLRFDAARYTVDVKVRVENRGSAPRTITVEWPWVVRHHDKAASEQFIGQRPTQIVWRREGHVGREKIDGKVLPIEEPGSGWLGIESTWYLSALLPQTSGMRLVASSTTAKDGTELTVAALASPTIAPGQAWEGRVLNYIGPKEYDRLAALGLDGSLDFGGFPIPRAWGGLPMEWLGIPILRLMNWVYDHVGNYGLAIILLTIVSKMLFYPLTVKSMRSMKAMQALQPQINSLRSKYRSDPQRLQRETMELYRKHRVNPLGGCLPMIAQVPIFYALYLALSVSVELQNAPFLCFGHIFGVDVWICDLARHDPTYVLPILMGVSMFVQQKMTPTTGDPRQAKMMLLMPVVFTFMFLNLPSGLVLYWTVSNVLQIFQQWLLNRSSTGGGAGARVPARA